MQHKEKEEALTNSELLNAKLSRMCSELSLGKSPTEQLEALFKDIEQNGEIVKDKRGKPILDYKKSLQRIATPDQNKKLNELVVLLKKRNEDLDVRIDRLRRKAYRIRSKIKADQK